MFRTIASCAGALVVVLIIGTLLWKTIKQESSRPSGPIVGTLANSPDSKQPVEAFTTTEMLGDYLLAAADLNSVVLKRIGVSSGRVPLDAGTKVAFQGISGPGQAKVKILDGLHKDQILYVNFAVIQGTGR